MVPLDGYYPEIWNTSQEEQNRDQAESVTPESSSSNDTHVTDQGIWRDIFGDLISYERPIREHLRGFRRITANNVLDHETRQKIFDLICHNPGISLSGLADLSDCNESTLRYHIFQISKENYISVFDQKKTSHFFENHSRFSHKEQKFLSRFTSGQSGRIMQVVHKHPGITRKELADELGVASPTVTRTVQQLADEGLILLVKEGRYTRHFIPNDSLFLVQ